MSEKYLGINQPVPVSVLEHFIADLLDGRGLDDRKVDDLLKGYIKGENRRKKALSHMRLILEKNGSMIGKIRERISGSRFVDSPENDKKIMMICLLANTFPIFYVSMSMLATIFKVQPRINTASIFSKLASEYGSNRGVYNAMNAVIHMLIEFGLIKRHKPGIFEKRNRFKTLSPFLSELCVYTDIRLSRSRTILFQDIAHRPWYDFFDLQLDPKQFELVKHSELKSGYGYLEVGE